MPVLPVSLIEPVWEQFSVLLPEHPAVSPTHPLRCHRRRVPDRTVFDHVLAALVHGSGYERISAPGCSDRTIRRRIQEWARLGLTERLHELALEQYDRLIGLGLEDVAVDGCITKAPSGGEVAGKSPVDRGKQGVKRSLLTDATGVPLHVVAAGANRHDTKLLDQTLAGLDAWRSPEQTPTVHLDCGYAGAPTQALLDQRELDGVVARKGIPAPVQTGKRWVIERTHAWMNGYGKLRRCTEKRAEVVAFYLFLAATFVTVRSLIREARETYRWDGRPTTRRLK